MAVSAGGRSHALLDPRGQVWIQCHLGPTGLSACKDWGLLESWYPKPATLPPMRWFSKSSPHARRFWARAWHCQVTVVMIVRESLVGATVFITAF